MNLGTRGQYINDLEELAALQVEETPDHYPEEGVANDSEADKLDEKIRAKYTVHLYAQWEDTSPTTDEPTKGANRYTIGSFRKRFGIIHAR